jgi:hypothetical protein
MAKIPKTPRTGAASAVLLNALKVLLTPLVRGLIAKGITFPDLAELLKAVYVEVAKRDSAGRGGRPSQSRITLLTGVHRKDVRRLSAPAAPTSARVRAASLGARLIGHWLGAARFRDADGKPLALPKSAPAGRPSFDALVAAVSTDVRPRAVLDEWRARRIVRIDTAGLIRLEAQAFVPTADFEQNAHFFGRNLRDHITAATHNLLAEGPPFLERAVFYDQLTPDAVAELREAATKLGSEALLDVNRRAVARTAAEDGRSDTTQRMTFGVYFYAVDEAPKPEPDDA